jgi:hypothetical protein
MKPEYKDCKKKLAQSSNLMKIYLDKITINLLNYRISYFQILNKINIQGSRWARSLDHKFNSPFNILILYHLRPFEEDLHKYRYSFIFHILFIQLFIKIHKNINIKDILTNSILIKNSKPYDINTVIDSIENYWKICDLVK